MYDILRTVNATFKLFLTRYNLRRSRTEKASNLVAGIGDDVGLFLLRDQGVIGGPAGGLLQPCNEPEDTHAAKDVEDRCPAEGMHHLRRKGQPNDTPCVHATVHQRQGTGPFLSGHPPAAQSLRT